MLKCPENRGFKKISQNFLKRRKNFLTRGGKYNILSIPKRKKHCERQ